MADKSAAGQRKRQRRIAADKPKGKPRGKPFEPGNAHAFKPGESGNPAGFNGAKTLSAAYRKLLALQPKADIAQRLYEALGYLPLTTAEAIAMSQIAGATRGKVDAAKEIRQATEGDTLNVKDMTDDELIDRLKQIADAAQSSGDTADH